jgi:hypothetical protein
MTSEGICMNFGRSRELANVINSAITGDKIAEEISGSREVGNGHLLYTYSETCPLNHMYSMLLHSDVMYWLKCFMRELIGTGSLTSFFENTK